MGSRKRAAALAAARDEERVAALAAAFDDDYDAAESSSKRDEPSAYNGYHGGQQQHQQGHQGQQQSSLYGESGRTGGGAGTGTGRSGTSRMERLIQEQKELQLLESRIREAAQHSMVGGSSSIAAIQDSAMNLQSQQGINPAKQLVEALVADSKGLKDPNAVVNSIAEKQAQLYLDRLNEYKQLAANDDDNFRDTAEDAESTGGVIDGGTWEHRKRAKEMLNTAAQNLELTLKSSGKRHMGSYIPQDVLNQFLKRAEAIKNGDKFTTINSEAAAANQEDYSEHKIDQGNVGFQLLQKSGWSEGRGLGASGEGIVAPLNAHGSGVGPGSGSLASITKSSANVTSGTGDIEVPTGPRDKATLQRGGAGRATAAASGSTSGRAGAGAATGLGAGAGAGVGARPTFEVDASDDSFDQYRKRMMLAYRFRPNPLNNPRRDYY